MSKCQICNNEILARPEKIKLGQKYCSQKCFGVAHSGVNNPHWNGGRKIDVDGYVKLRLNNTYIQEHRIIMEKHIGRKLKIKEVVHHINGIRSDNRIENLKLFTNHSEHFISAGHRKTGKNVSCKFCGKIFYRKLSDCKVSNYCSYSCLAKLRWKEDRQKMLEILGNIRKAN